MSKWFERHPYILGREVKQLSNNSNYSQKSIRWENVLVSGGSFLVRRNGDVKPFPAAFLYPDSTPYALPSVFLLKQELTVQEIHSLASQPFLKASSELGKRGNIYYKRHQNANGSLCLLEQDNLEQLGAEVFEASSIIDRVLQWLSSIETNRPMPESSEVELYAHFPVTAENRVLLTAECFEGAGQQGTMYFTSLLNGEKNVASSRVLIGAAILDDTSVLPTPNSTPWQFMPKEINTADLLRRYPQKVKSEIKAQAMLEGFWWQVLSEPPVFQNITHLITFLGDGSPEKGIRRFPEPLKKALREQPPFLLIGLRFMNRRKSPELPEWLIMKLVKPDKLQIHRGSHFKAVLDNYQIQACPSEAFTANAYHIRNAGRVDYDKVSQQAVTVVGCGALGSEVADCLGKAGIGQLQLVDNQLLHAHNSVRHLAGYGFAEILKVLAVGALIKSHNQFVEVSYKFNNVLHTQLTDFLHPTGFGVSTIADDNTEEYLNEQAVYHRRTMFYARALRGGKAARIFRVVPGQDACFRCLVNYRRDKHTAFIDIPDDAQLPTLRNECNNPIRPASAADLKLIAAITSRLLLDELQATSSVSANQWVWTTEPLPGRPSTSGLPFCLEAYSLSPHPDCPHCNALKPVTVAVRTAALEYMQKETISRAGTETGGVLVGTMDLNGAIQVEQASGPGPKAIHSATGFERDVEFCQRFLETHAAAGLVYVGEWHSHPNESNKPSQTDLNSLADIALQPSYLTTKPVMFILTRSGVPRCTVHPVSAPYYHLGFNISPGNE